MKQLVVNESTQCKSVPFEKVEKELRTILKPYNDCETLCTRLMAYLRKDLAEDEPNCSFEKLNNLVEFLQCYTIEVKKNRNASNRMDDILHMRTKDTSKYGLPQKPELNRSDKVLMFIWQRMCEQDKNLAQAFKIFDTRDKGRLKKTDFALGLHKYQIQMS